jgi:hypothetical protein
MNQLLLEQFLSQFLSILTAVLSRLIPEVAVNEFFIELVILPPWQCVRPSHSDDSK